jgi:hypothetical protein
VARPAPPVEHQLRAFELVRDGEGLPGARERLRQEFGIEVSIETVRRWALIGAKAHSWLQENAEDGETYTGPEFVRLKFASFLDGLAARGFAELDRGDAAYKDVAPILLRIATEQARALGGYAALRIHHEGNGSPPQLDPATARVVDAMLERHGEQLSGPTEAS